MTLDPKANLKLCGQKLFNIDAQGGNLSNLGGLLPAARLAEDTGLIHRAASLIPEWRQPTSCTFSIELLLAQRVFLAASGHPSAIDCSNFKNDPVLKSIMAASLNQDVLPSQSTATRLTGHLRRNY